MAVTAPRGADPRRVTPVRPAPVVVASWVDGSLHLWGWDGAHTALPNALLTAFDRPAWPTNPLRLGNLSNVDIALPDGRTVRPASVRLSGERAASWLTSLRPAATLGDSVAWLAAVAVVARSTVTAGLVTPCVRTDRDLPVARWLPLEDPTLAGALDALAASMPPICLPVPDDPTTVADIHAVMVDGLARNRLADDDWRPDLPTARAPATVAARAVFRALASPDPLISGSATAHPDEVHELATRFERHHRRVLGEPVVVPRVRLIVPEDVYDDWEIRLEVVDELDPGRWCTAEDVWDANPLAVELAGGESRVGVLADVVGELALALAGSVEVAAELATTHEPSSLELDVEAAGRFLEQAPAELDRLGIDLIGPERLVRAGVSVRGKAAPSPPSDHPGQFGREAVVQWRMVVADEDGPTALSEAELARAESAGATLLHTGRRWVRIDPAALRRARRRLEEHERDDERVDAITLLRLAGDGEVEADPGSGLDHGPLGRAARRRARRGARAGGVRRGAAAVPTPRLELAAVPPSPRARRLPGRRHGPRQDGHHPRPPDGPSRPAPRGVPAVGRPQLGGRGGPVRARAARGRPPRRRAGRGRQRRARARRRPRRHRPGGDRARASAGRRRPRHHHLRAAPSRHRAPRRRRLVDRGGRRGPAHQEPRDPAAKAFRVLRAGQKLALTGTPVENRLADLWAILDAVNPGMLGSRERFRHRFGKPIERDGDGEAAARLRRITQPFVLRRTKADRTLVPDLPDKIEQIAWAGLTREQAVLYQHVVDQLLADAANTSGMKRRGLVLAALTRLKQICNHPAHVLGDGSRLAGRSGKLERYDELVAELLDVGERALVFTQFREMGELLRRHAAERLDLRVPFLHGGVSRARRDEMVADFQAGLGPPLLLISLKAGGTGLNLTAASQVIHYDRWWNPAVEDQATDRAWRIGQGRTVVVHKMVCEGTVEERIATLIDQKRALADAVVGTGESWLSELSTAELRDLVALDARP